MTRQFLISGFGGQGVLFTGKFLAYKGLIEEKQVSWLPSYGPEMRGGTASCSVIVSDDPVGSPIVSKPDVLIAMNIPSLDRYEDSVVPGGIVVADSTLISRGLKRTDVKPCVLPAAQLAQDNNIPTLANMIIAGRLLALLGEYREDSVAAALGKVISARHSDMLEVNRKALEIGRDLK